MKYLLSLWVSLLFIACGETEKNSESKPAPEQTNAVSIYSDTFNNSFKASLTAYYALKDAFIEENIKKILFLT